VEGLVKEQCEFDLVVKVLIGIKNTTKKVVALLGFHHFNN
jgi:hypothetical protein